MPSNSEMYERGALDAEHDDLNPFYYQHYFYYRMGYDQARRELRGGVLVASPPWLIPLLAFLGGALTLLLIGLIVSWLLGPRSEPDPTLASPPILSPTLPSAPPPDPAPTPTLLPTPTPGLRVGRLARVVNVGEVPLRARFRPGLDSGIRIVTRFPQGSTVTILEGPRRIDGVNWWHIAGTSGDGWSIERSADGTLFLEPIP